MITAAELIGPRFRCGHPKTSDNTYSASGGKNGARYTRCKICSNKLTGAWVKENRDYLLRLESAMRVIRTWASVAGCLDAANVVNLVDKTLKK